MTEEPPFWEANAETWSQAVRTRAIESRAVTDPAILHEILRGAPQAVLDLGCGEGWIGRALTPAGIAYTGTDGSAALIELARQDQPGTEFIHASYEALPQALGARVFDVCVFNFALLAEDLRAALRTARALTQPQGVVLVQTLHPCFALSPYRDGWLSEDFRNFPLPFAGKMPWYGRTLAGWTRAIAESGLRIEEIVEPGRNETERPLSMIFRLRVH